MLTSQLGLAGSLAPGRKRHELEMHAVGEQPPAAPGEPPPAEDGDDTGVLMGRLAELVRGRVDVQGHTPGMMGDACLRVAVEEPPRIAARIVLTVDELGEPFP